MLGCGGHPPPPSPLLSLCDCTLTHSAPSWSSWSLGLAWGFEVVVKARGHEEGRGVIMRSSPQLLLLSLPSSPFVCPPPFYFHATHLFPLFLYFLPAFPCLISPILPFSYTQPV